MSLQTRAGRHSTSLSTSSMPPRFLRVPLSELKPRSVCLPSALRHSAEVPVASLQPLGQVPSLERSCLYPEPCAWVTSNRKPQVLSWSAPILCLFAERCLSFPSNWTPVRQSPPLSRPLTETLWLGQYRTVVSWKGHHDFCLRVIFCGEIQACGLSLARLPRSWFNAEHAGNPRSERFYLFF